MVESKIILTEADLNSPVVEERLRQLSALESAQASYRETANRPSRLPVPSDERGGFFYNTIVYMTIFGFLGGICAFGVQEAIAYFNPNRFNSSDDLLTTRAYFMNEQAKAENKEGRWRELRRTHSFFVVCFNQCFNKWMLEAENFKNNIRSLDISGRDNPYYRISTDPNLNASEYKEQLGALQDKDNMMKKYAEILSYCACGVILAIALGTADSLSTRNFRGALVYGSIGAALGLVGGVIASFLGDKIFNLICGSASSSSSQASLGRLILARSIGFGILGIFFSAAPGLVLRSRRKLVFGLIGGLLGGILGGALLDPINQIIGASPGHLDWIGRITGITAIGVITGLGIGIIENAAKLGWLKVVEGLIVGKQFILYRNPSFIGSSPQCEIYLFKDNQVLRRHAALHMAPGAYEIEDLGTHATLVNGRAVVRARLRSGDRVQIGRTCFVFHEKQRVME